MYLGNLSSKSELNVESVKNTKTKLVSVAPPCLAHLPAHLASDQTCLWPSYHHGGQDH